VYKVKQEKHKEEKKRQIFGETSTKHLGLEKRYILQGKGSTVGGESRRGEEKRVGGKSTDNGRRTQSDTELNRGLE